MRRILTSVLYAGILLGGVSASAQQAFVPAAPQMTNPGGFIAGRFYGPPLNGTPGNAALAAANRLFLLPFFVPAGSYTAKTLNFDIGTGIAGAWNARLCLYQDTSTTAGLSGSLATNGDTGTVAVGSGTVTGVQSGQLNGSTGITVAGPAWYWVGIMADTTGQSLFSLNAASNSDAVGNVLGGDIAIRLTTNLVTGIFVAATFGACPGTFSSPTYNVNTSVTPYVNVGF